MQKEYFAAINSVHGFVSFFDSILPEETACT